VLLEIVVFLVIVFVVAVALLWRGRRGTTGQDAPVALANIDRPEPRISSESSLGPMRNLGRPFHVDRGERPLDGGGQED